MAGLACAGVIGTACTSQGGTHTSTRTTTTHRTTTTTSGGGVTTTSSTTTTSTTGISACAQVTATPGQTQGAAGTIVGTITVAEVGTGTCTMMGYPTLARFGAGGAAVPITLVHGITVNLPGPATQPPTLVTLTATQQAEFTFQYNDVITGTETSCATSTTLSVTTPGASGASAPIPLTMAPCNNGTVEVSPVYAATAG
jgi:hypothetical protein